MKYIKRLLLSHYWVWRILGPVALAPLWVVAWLTIVAEAVVAGAETTWRYYRADWAMLRVHGEPIFTREGYEHFKELK